ncbi:MAG: bacillithiol biosynthesis deacetylase BshB1 [Candidatus Eisenbacteria bacterium]|nr:bacillithiol biosynthesis deacetylase BshB1 [Candidatus Eisenbacteria bacterium]
MNLDILVFGPHPDDAEIGAGGLLLRMKAEGRTTGIIDMTRGDMGWGTPEERDKECEEAGRILGLDVRETLGLPDCRVEDDFETRCKVAQAIRRYRPQIVMAPYWELPPGRGLGHTDHMKTGLAVSHGFNFAHLRKMPVEGEPYQARALFYYFIPPGVRPTFVVDVTQWAEKWRAALECHRTQFANPEKPQLHGIPTNFLDWFEVFARQHGFAVGARYAQAFLSVAPLKVNDPMVLVRDVVPRP